MRALLLIGAVGFGLAGCGAPKPIYRTPAPDDAVRVSRGASEAPSSKQIEEISSVWLGTPYRYGGATRHGIDCSALVQNILGDLGASLPRTVRDQRTVGDRVAMRDMSAGDLVFFQLESTRVNHVGVALDGSRFIHASSSRGVVIDHMMDRYFSRRFVEARRVLESH